MQLLPANAADVYWGLDTDFAARLADQSASWEHVQNEYLKNVAATVVDDSSVVVSDYPIVIDASLTSDVLQTQLTIESGKGIGHIPVIIKNAPAELQLRPELSVDDSWVSAVHYPDNIDIHAFYQAYMNADGTFDYAFNILRPEGSLDLPMKVRLTDH